MKNCPPEYWIWLQSALGAGAQTDELLTYFGDPEAMYNAGTNEWKLSGLLTYKRVQLLKETSPSMTKAVFDECKNNGYRIITPSDEEYPERLRNLRNMPLVLYCSGDVTALSDVVSIGMVGTRKASNYGIEIAQKLSFSLAKAGATVVSGGALGIDSEAHAGAMLANGRTVAVLGCGLSFPYLMENAPLRRAITRHGCLVSEYQPSVGASKMSFPIRNRLISGLTLGTVVVEAGVKSGSLITAKDSLEQGKDVFAVPGDIVRSSFDGTNKLILDGAKPVFSALDVLSEYEYKYGEFIDFSSCRVKLSEIEYVDYRNYKKKKENAEAKKENAEVKKEKTEVKKENTVTKKERSFEKNNVTVSTKETKKKVQNKNTQETEKPQKPDDISAEATSVFDILSYEPVHIDDIVRKSNLKMNEVLSALTELELEGVCEQLKSKHYILKQSE